MQMIEDIVQAVFCVFHYLETRCFSLVLSMRDMDFV